MLKSLSATGGERKRLTLLFADIRNSTTLIDSLDPEDALQRLQPALACMKGAVERYEGVVTRTQGDGVMACFGAPKPHEDHAVRACMAALSMQEAVARLGDPHVKIRVGIHTGEVVVQAVENTLYQTYDAAGANVHLASRLEAMADEGGILLTRETFLATRQFIKAESLGLKTVRGLSAQIEVFKLTGVRQAPESELFRSRRLSSLTGRDHVLRTLETELDSTIRGEGRVLGVVGEAGIGKSRLCFEFAEECRKRGIRVYEARVLAHGHVMPLQPVLELLRDYFGISATEPAESARQRVARSLQKLPISNEALDFVLEFLGLAASASPGNPIDASMRKTRLLELVRAIASSTQPNQANVILIEDLHWIDAASGEFVEALADAVVDTTTLLLLNFRPGFVTPWMQKSHYRQIGLAPLQATESNELLQELLGDDMSLALVGRNIAERARGNPFFIEELIQGLVERGDLQGTRGAYQLAGGIGDIPLPSTVEAVLAARIDRLEESPRSVLQSAAVIGREVPLTILESVAEVNAADLTDALQRLRRAELLYELPPHQESQYAFRHPLIQEVAYRSMLRGRRSKIHGAVGQAIETQFKERPGEWAALLAYHWEQAGQMVKAAQASMRAAVWIGATDSSEGFRSWKKVLELLATQPPSLETDNFRMIACGQVMNFGWREGMSADEAEVFFEEGKRLALAAGNMRVNALIHAAFGRHLAASGSADQYIEKIREAEQLSGSTQDASLLVTLKAVLCHALRLAGRMSEALEENIEATNHAKEIGELDRTALGFDIERWLTIMRAQILLVLGRFDEVHLHLGRLLQSVTKDGDLTNHLTSVTYVDLARAEGDVQLAERHAARAFAIAVKSGSPYVRVYAQTARGIAHIVAGRFDSAVEDLVAALSFARRRKSGLELEARILADLANAYRLKGDLDNASRIATEAIEVSTARNARIPECLAHIVSAEVLWATGADMPRVEEELRQARALREQTGALVYQPLIDGVESRIRGIRPSPQDQIAASNNVHCSRG